jgi:hypothetical protein
LQPQWRPKGGQGIAGINNQIRPNARFRQPLLAPMLEEDGGNHQYSLIF